VHLCQARPRLLSHTPCSHWRSRYCYPAGRVRLPIIGQPCLSSSRRRFQIRPVKLATHASPRVACGCGTAGRREELASSSVRRSSPSVTFLRAKLFFPIGRRGSVRPLANRAGRHVRSSPAPLERPIPARASRARGALRF